MQKLEVWHNKSCSKSNEAFQILRQLEGTLEVVEYMKEAITVEKLEELLTKLDLKASEIVRTKEKLYQEKYKDKKLSNKKWMEILAKHPELIERPIVISGDKAVIARPIEKINTIIDF